MIHDFIIHSYNFPILSYNILPAQSFYTTITPIFKTKKKPFIFKRNPTFNQQRVSSDLKGHSIESSDICFNTWTRNWSTPSQLCLLIILCLAIFHCIALVNTSHLWQIILLHYFLLYQFNQIHQNWVQSSGWLSTTLDFLGQKSKQNSCKVSKLH